MRKNRFSVAALVLAFGIAACSNEPKPAIGAVDEAALSAGEEMVEEDTASISATQEDVPPVGTMESGSNDGTERQPERGSKLLPADPD